MEQAVREAGARETLPEVVGRARILGDNPGVNTAAESNGIARSYNATAFVRS